MSVSKIYQVRYAGRAQALHEELMYEKTIEGIVALSADGVHKYHVDLDIIDGDGEMPICECAEYQRNIRMVIAESEGTRIAPHGGRLCKHIILARDIHHLYDGSLLDVLRGLPEEYQEEAREAYRTERKRVLKARLH